MKEPIRRATKRLLDIVIAGTALILLAPAMGLIALAIRLEMGSPVLFRQLRPGRNAQPFEMVKFRTMRNDRGPDGRLIPIERRTTRLGSLLRRLSLDELPELWTILKGDMSLVGPRPLLMEYLPHYTAHQARRHEVKPGLTGWAQVNGRHNSRWEDRFDLDVWYVDHQSLALDLRIMAMTAKMVVSGEGAGLGQNPPAEFTRDLDVADFDPR